MPNIDAATASTLLPSYDVVIPCYNREHVVADATYSALAQDHAPARVIVVDDGSTDQSAAVCRRLEAEHPGRVVACVLPRNGGASHARNVGTSLCRSTWIAYLDSDDVWLPGAARALVGAGEQSDVVCGYFARQELGGPIGSSECEWWGDDIRIALRFGGIIGPSWSIVRRSVVEAVNGFDPTFHNCNDWDFFTRAAAAGAVFKRVEDLVALYRTTSGSRLVHDTVSSRRNAERILSHPYLRGTIELVPS